LSQVGRSLRRRTVEGHGYTELARLADRNINIKVAPFLTDNNTGPIIARAVL
jgi:hypothetical protein